MQVPPRKRRFRGEFEGGCFSKRLILIMCGIAGICHIDDPDGVSSQLIHRQFVQDFSASPDNLVSPALIVDRRSEALRAVS
jgi:hypothetical protein